MPYNSADKIKQHNAAYYEANKLKLNAQRLVKQVKDKKRRCPSRDTIEKYKHYLDENQLEFLYSLVDNCEKEREIKYEMPPPQPIIEVPAPEPIEFVPRLPQTEVFKANDNENTFTLDEVRALIHYHRNRNTSENAYRQQMKAVFKLLGNTNTDNFATVYTKWSAEQIVQKIKNKYQAPDLYVKFLLYVVERSEKLKRIITEAKYKKLLAQLQPLNAAAEVARLEKRQADQVDYISVYKDLFAVEKKWEKDRPASKEHLLAILYSIGCYADDGTIQLISRNYFWNVLLVSNNNQMRDKGENYYNHNNGRLLLNVYKTSDKYEPYDIILHKHARKYIKMSVQQAPRKYLFETGKNNNGGRYAEGGSGLANQVKLTTGYGINVIRKTIENYEIQTNNTDRQLLAHAARHSPTVSFTSYQQISGAPTEQNYDTKYDKRLVEVKISKGRNKGKTLMGVISRNEGSDRFKYPYQVTYPTEDNETPDVFDEDELLNGEGVKLIEVNPTKTSKTKSKPKPKPKPKPKSRKSKRR
jgi:hypothetical protein